jgi:hypothetical protein
VINFYNKEKRYILKQIEKRNKEEDKLKQNAKVKALELIGEKISTDVLEKEKNKNKGFFGNLINKFSFYRKIKNNLERKRLFDEINLLIEEEDKVKHEVISAKLENIHK